MSKVEQLSHRTITTIRRIRFIAFASILLLVPFFLFAQKDEDKKEEDNNKEEDDEADDFDPEEYPSEAEDDDSDPEEYPSEDDSEVDSGEEGDPEENDDEEDEGDYSEGDDDDDEEDDDEEEDEEDKDQKDQDRKKLSSAKSDLPDHSLTEGTILSVKDGVAQVTGLLHLKSGEMVEFQGTGVYGLALNLERHLASIVVFGDDSEIKAGDSVKSLGTLMKVTVGPHVLGHVVDALARSVDGTTLLEWTKLIETSSAKEQMLIERKAPGIITRESIHEPLQTGIKAIDALLPIGRGQRELIIGDRQTGKTTIALDSILNQKDLTLPESVKAEVISIYVSVGQKRSSLFNVWSTLSNFLSNSYTCIVGATASENAPLLYLAPYTGCAIGEYFRDEGLSALIIYDDLTKHAAAYRQMSLLLRRPPGREAYPGDVFYLHSRLLERACKLNDNFGGGSLTALPIVETQAGDVSGYIPTNIISITDGQIFLEKELFNNGIRPAINVGISVSRIGSAAQCEPMKQLAGSLKLQLAVYREVASFAQFDTDIDAETKTIISRGKLLTELLKQGANKPLSTFKQLLILFGGLYGSVDTIALERIFNYESTLFIYVSNVLFKGLSVLPNSLPYFEEFDLQDNILESLIASYESTIDIENSRLHWGKVEKTLEKTLEKLSVRFFSTLPNDDEQGEKGASTSVEEIGIGASTDLKTEKGPSNTWDDGAWDKYLFTQNFSQVTNPIESRKSLNLDTYKGLNENAIINRTVLEQEVLIINTRILENNQKLNNDKVTQAIVEKELQSMSAKKFIVVAYTVQTMNIFSHPLKDSRSRLAPEVLTELFVKFGAEYFPGVSKEAFDKQVISDSSKFFLFLSRANPGERNLILETLVKYRLPLTDLSLIRDKKEFISVAKELVFNPGLGIKPAFNTKKGKTAYTPKGKTAPHNPDKINHQKGKTAYTPKGKTAPHNPDKINHQKGKTAYTPNTASTPWHNYKSNGQPQGGKGKE